MIFNSDLCQAVENFAWLMLPLSEKDLEHEGIWKDHTDEGIRFYSHKSVCAGKTA